MKKCKYCMSNIDENAKICPNCRKRQKPILTKLQIILIIVFAILIGITVRYVTNTIEKTKEENEKIELLIYKDKAKGIMIDISLTTIDLSSIGSSIIDNWYETIVNNKYTDIDTAVQTALSDNKELINNTKSKHSSIKSQYRELMNYESNDYEMNQLKRSVKELYTAYDNYYKLVTEPSGNFNDYSEKMVSELDNMNEQIEEVTELISE